MSWTLLLSESWYSSRTHLLICFPCGCQSLIWRRSPQSLALSVRKLQTKGGQIISCLVWMENLFCLVFDFQTVERSSTPAPDSTLFTSHASSAWTASASTGGWPFKMSNPQLKNPVVTRLRSRQGGNSHFVILWSWTYLSLSLYWWKLHQKSSVSSMRVHSKSKSDFFFNCL